MYETSQYETRVSGRVERTQRLVTIGLRDEDREGECVCRRLYID